MYTHFSEWFTQNGIPFDVKSIIFFPIWKESKINFSGWSCWIFSRTNHQMINENFIFLPLTNIKFINHLITSLMNIIKRYWCVKFICYHFFDETVSSEISRYIKFCVENLTVDFYDIISALIINHFTYSYIHLFAFAFNQLTIWFQQCM